MRKKRQKGGNGRPSVIPFGDQQKYIFSEKSVFGGSRRPLGGNRFQNGAPKGAPEGSRGRDSAGFEGFGRKRSKM